MFALFVRNQNRRNWIRNIRIYAKNTNDKSIEKLNQKGGVKYAISKKRK